MQDFFSFSSPCLSSINLPLYTHCSVLHHLCSSEKSRSSAFDILAWKCVTNTSCLPQISKNLVCERNKNVSFDTELYMDFLTKSSYDDSFSFPISCPSLNSSNTSFLSSWHPFNAGDHTKINEIYPITYQFKDIIKELQATQLILKPPKGTSYLHADDDKNIRLSDIISSCPLEKKKFFSSFSEQNTFPFLNHFNNINSNANNDDSYNEVYDMFNKKKSGKLHERKQETKEEKREETKQEEREETKQEKCEEQIQKKKKKEKEVINVPLFKEIDISIDFPLSRNLNSLVSFSSLSASSSFLLNNNNYYYYKNYKNENNNNNNMLCTIRNECKKHVYDVKKNKKEKKNSNMNFYTSSDKNKNKNKLYENESKSQCIKGSGRRRNKTKYKTNFSIEETVCSNPLFSSLNSRPLYDSSYTSKNNYIYSLCESSLSSSPHPIVTRTSPYKSSSASTKCNTHTICSNSSCALKLSSFRHDLFCCVCNCIFKDGNTHICSFSSYPLKCYTQSVNSCTHNEQEKNKKNKKKVEQIYISEREKSKRKVKSKKKLNHANYDKEDISRRFHGSLFYDNFIKNYHKKYNFENSTRNKDADNCILSNLTKAFSNSCSYNNYYKTTRKDEKRHYIYNNKSEASMKNNEQIFNDSFSYCNPNPFSHSVDSSSSFPCVILSNSLSESEDDLCIYNILIDMQRKNESKRKKKFNNYGVENNLHVHDNFAHNNSFNKSKHSFAFSKRNK